MTLLRIKASLEGALRFKEKVESSKILKVVWIQEEQAARLTSSLRRTPS